MIQYSEKQKRITIDFIIIGVILIITQFSTACMKTEEVEIQATDVQNINYEEIQLSEQEAIEIAKKFAIPGSDDFEYYGYLIENDARTHIVKADVCGIEAEYEIYDFDSSIKRVSLRSNIDHFTPVEISDEEAEQIALEWAEKYWGDYDIEIITCKVDASNKINIYGTLENEDVQRGFSIWFNHDGNLISMESKYPQEYTEKYEHLADDYYENKQQILIRVDEIRITEGTDYQYSLYNYDGNEKHQVTTDHSMTTYIINAEDNVVEFINNGNYSVSDSMSITMEEAEEYVLQLAEKIWGEANRKVTVRENHDNGFYIDIDEIGADAGTFCDISITLNGDGEPTSIQLNNTLMNTVQVKAEEIAVESVIQSHPKSKGEYSIVKSYESNFLGKEIFMVDIEYRTENSTAIDYPFDVSVVVDKVDGSTQIYSEKNDLSCIETMGNEKAIEMAKGYIADEYSIDKAKLEFVSIEIVEHNAIEYNVILEYGELQYSCGLLVDTGELDSIQRNTKQ